MKRERLVSACWALLTASLAAVGAAGCLATAFSFPFSAGMVGRIVLLCALFALWRSLPRGRWLCMAALGLILGLFWQRWQLSLQLEAVVWHISRFYDSAYGWGTASWSGQSLYGVSTDNALVALGGLVGLITAATVCSGRSGIPALLTGILPLAACVVVTDTVPDSKYLFALMLGILLLLMTQSFRRKSQSWGNRLAALVAPPLVLALALLFALVPREGYTPPPEDTPQRIAAWFEELGNDLDLGELVTDLFSGLEEEKVDLRSVGPKTEERYAVMEVTAFRDGSLYLRGQAFDTYDGKSWSRSEGDWSLDQDYHCDTYAGTIHIVTKTTHDVLYTPYNMSPADANRMEQGRIGNSDGSKTYDVEQWDASFSDNALSAVIVPQEVVEQYCQLPENTREDALAFLQEHLDWFDQYLPGPGSSILEEDPNRLQASGWGIAEAVAGLVRSSADYSLRTPRMPAGEEDFAMWFLNESDTGYCVHFATATTVLLRALGIPARYVTGYLADGAAGEAVTVRGGDAHAWVEYWNPWKGWQMLESTPSGENSPVATTAPTEAESQPQEATDPSGTEPDETLPDATRPDTPAGDGDDTPGNKEPMDLNWLWMVLKGILILAAAVSLILGQRHARLCLRDFRRRRGSAKEQALYRWRETELLCRVLGQSPPEDLWELARKAKFSQHPICPEELDQFDAFRTGATSRLWERPWYWQILCRLILALY